MQDGPKGQSVGPVVSRGSRRWGWPANARPIRGLRGEGEQNTSRGWILQSKADSPVSLEKSHYLPCFHTHSVLRADFGQGAAVECVGSYCGDDDSGLLYHPRESFFIVRVCDHAEKEEEEEEEGGGQDEEEEEQVVQHDYDTARQETSHTHTGTSAAPISLRTSFSLPSDLPAAANFVEADEEQLRR